MKLIARVRFNSIYAGGHDDKILYWCGRVMKTQQAELVSGKTFEKYVSFYTLTQIGAKQSCRIIL